MKKIIALLAVAAVLIVSPAYGSFSWELYDFGSGPFDHNNNWSPVSYPWGIGHHPSGGEGFDLEGFNYCLDGGVAHLSLTNSFGYTAHSSWYNPGTYNLGDIFFGFDGGPLEYAIDVSTGELYHVTQYLGIPDDPGTYEGYTDIENQVYPWEIGDGEVLGMVEWRMNEFQGLEENPMSGNGDTWVWEFAFDASLIEGFSTARSINFHNTLACGNDLIEETYAVVPEPAAFLLFGIGLAGAGLYRRFRK